MEGYRAREIRLLERWEPEGWRLKVYGIGADGRMPAAALVDSAKETATRVLDAAASATEHHGLGFLGIHRGRGADVAFVDWWAAENELHHHLYVAEAGRPDTLRPRAPHELTACVWDLEVIAFERDAWVRSVLGHPDSPRWDEYLSRALERRAAADSSTGSAGPD
ncbi:MAG: isochorismatase [Gemmatimonadota bacterium]